MGICDKGRQRETERARAWAVGCVGVNRIRKGGSRTVGVDSLVVVVALAVVADAIDFTVGIVLSPPQQDMLERAALAPSVAQQKRLHFDVGSNIEFQQFLDTTRQVFAPSNKGESETHGRDHMAETTLPIAWNVAFYFARRSHQHTHTQAHEANESRGVLGWNTLTPLP